MATWRARLARDVFGVLDICDEVAPTRRLSVRWSCLTRRCLDKPSVTRGGDVARAWRTIITENGSAVDANLEADREVLSEAPSCVLRGARTGVTDVAALIGGTDANGDVARSIGVTSLELRRCDEVAPTRVFGSPELPTRRWSLDEPERDTHGKRYDLRLAVSKHKKYPFDDWSNSSYQQDTYSSMRNQPSRDIIRFLLETEQDMNLTEQELDQWIEQRDQEAEKEIKSILQKISAETMSAIPLESVEVNEVTPIEDYWSEPEEIIEVSLHEPDISIAQDEVDEAENEIDVILERPEEPQKESKEDQPLVLVKPPTLPCIFVRPYKGVAVKERSQIFYIADTFVSADHDLIDSNVLKVSDELLHLKEGMYDGPKL
ncbi:hypothetical protein Sjap_010487 [Stephania japonica]|uniref:Uncharacterized protein n=1 Tax=Stephania japonica TaxID=461633 RepID=A0AAP0P6G4_9MAGN